ncbi:hypothetical protein NIASO_19305 [Niabella soli DSM 19437]|uniref:Uncharacterized protein n=1 Tax=Niabella soli DSM 19437 TaxID=929713 RepID=W0F892_9BACT|nr:hypothetical protein NIASO_19305 [Niabella soli DSM 19437]
MINNFFIGENLHKCSILCVCFKAISREGGEAVNLKLPKNKTCLIIAGDFLICENQGNL